MAGEALKAQKMTVKSEGIQTSHIQLSRPFVINGSRKKSIPSLPPIALDQSLEPREETIEGIKSPCFPSIGVAESSVPKGTDTCGGASVPLADRDCAITGEKLYEKEKPYLDSYLKSIISHKTGKYKSIQLSPLRYAGGKSKAVGLILESLPKLKNKKVVSPFFGGGSLELCLCQNLGFEIVGYDTFDMLVNFWNVLIKDKSTFILELTKFKVNKEEFLYNRGVLLHHWEKVRPNDLKSKTRKKVKLKDEDLTLLDDNRLLQAVYYYYNMSLSYGPMFIGWPSSSELNKAKFERRIKRLESLNLQNVTIRCKNFEDIIQEHSKDFLFLVFTWWMLYCSKRFHFLEQHIKWLAHASDYFCIVLMLFRRCVGFEQGGRL